MRLEAAIERAMEGAAAARELAGHGLLCPRRESLRGRRLSQRDGYALRWLYLEASCERRRHASRQR